MTLAIRFDHDDVCVPSTARRQRNASIRRNRHLHAPPRHMPARPARRRSDRCAVRHRHLQSTGCPFRPARDSQRIGVAAPVQHGDPCRAVRQSADRRCRRRGHQPVQRRRFDDADRRPVQLAARPRTGDGIDGRRPHDRPADPAGDGHAARPGRVGARRRAHRHQRHDVRRDASPTAPRFGARSKRVCSTAPGSPRSAFAAPGIRPTTSTGRASRASGSCRSRSAGTAASSR